MTLSLDGDAVVKQAVCAHCQEPYRRVYRFILRDGTAHAVCFASLHTHDAVREAWLDVILGTFGADETAPNDHVTFGCRVGPVANSDEPAATAVAAAAPFSDKPIFGRKLTRDEALADPRVDEFWEIVDFVLVSDAAVHEHVYGHRLKVEGQG